MKVPPPTTAPNSAPVKPTSNTGSVSTKKEAQSIVTSSGDDATPPAGGHSFASVLEGMTRGYDRRDPGKDERRDDPAKRESGDDAAKPKPADREREARELEDALQKTDPSGHGVERGGVHETLLSREMSGAAPALRAILHIADLERIVAAVRTQAVAGGGREITLELSRSVLEGLRIKLRTNEAGRIDAEFITASERVRTQIDARTADLANLLRSRGIPLQTLKTSIGTDSSSQEGDRENKRQSLGGFAAEARLTPRVTSEQIPETDSADILNDKDLTNRTLYRA